MHLKQEGKIQMTSVLFNMGFDKHYNLQHSDYKLSGINNIIVTLGIFDTVWQI